MMNTWWTMMSHNFDILYLEISPSHPAHSVLGVPTQHTLCKNSHSLPMYVRSAEEDIWKKNAACCLQKIGKDPNPKIGKDPNPQIISEMSAKTGWLYILQGYTQIWGEFGSRTEWTDRIDFEKTKASEVSLQFISRSLRLHDMSVHVWNWPRQMSCLSVCCGCVSMLNALNWANAHLASFTDTR